MWLWAGNVEDSLKCSDEFRVQKITGITGKHLDFMKYLLHGVGWLVSKQ
jgi:hypothetical protein